MRGASQALIRFAKSSGAAVVLVGHVTKDGQIAGPRVVEHMVDAVMSFEGEGAHAFRMLRAAKNRFGATDEIGVFEMTGRGPRRSRQPLGVVSRRPRRRRAGRGGVRRRRGRAAGAGRNPGAGRALDPWARRAARSSAGTRAGLPWCWRCWRRTAASSSARTTSISTSPGALRIAEPAADLAAAAALVSSLVGVALPHEAVYFGEIALSGAVRAVGHADLRMKEAAKLGFARAFAPPAPQGRATRRLDAVVAASRRSRAWWRISPLPGRRSPRRLTRTNGVAIRADRWL